MSAALEIKYDGDDKKLMDKYALGNYVFAGLTKGNGSPFYAQHDDDHDKEKTLGRAIVIRDWENDKNWIGTVSISDSLYDHCNV